MLIIFGASREAYVCIICYRPCMYHIFDFSFDCIYIVELDGFLLTLVVIHLLVGFDKNVKGQNEQYQCPSLS